MSTRITFAAVTGAALLLIPSAALAKGAVSGEIEGPGSDGGITISGSGEGGNGSDLSRLADSSGFWPAAYGQVPDPMLDAAPDGDLGPRYLVTYVMSTQPRETIVQEIYPFAEGGPVTYMAPDQPFYGMEHTGGGWYQGGATLTGVLADIGLPDVAPAVDEAPVTDAKEVADPRPATQTTPSTSTPWTTLLLSLGAAAAAGAFLLLRRRDRVAA